MDKNDEFNIEKSKRLMEKAIDRSLETTLGSFKKISEKQLVAMLGAMSVPKDHGDPVPMLATIDTEGTSVCHGFVNFGDLSGTDARQAFMYQVGKRLSEEGQMIMMAYMGFYAWQTRVTHDDMKKLRSGMKEPLSPSEDPDRQEILAFSGSTLIGQMATAAIPTNRNQFKPTSDSTKFPPFADIEIKYTTNKDTDVTNALMVAFWNGVIDGAPTSDKD